MLKRLCGVLCLLAVVAFATHRYLHRVPTPGTDEMKAKLEATSLKFFLDHAHPLTGQVRDAAQNFAETPESNRMSSIAATGFGLAVIANAATRGMLDMKFAHDYANKTILFARDHIARRRGWFLHFCDWETGAAYGANDEYSTIDTELFMVGALYAAQVVGDPKLVGVVDKLYAEMDFQDALTDGGTKPDKKTLSMAYDDNGYSAQQWDMYAEERALMLLALGHPTRPLATDSWRSFARDVSVADVAGGIKMMGVDYALFTHQYSDLFVDFRGFHDGYDNYFANGIKATRLHRELALEKRDNATVREGFWGYSAGASPANGGYEAFRPYTHKGIVCIGCAMGSAMFLPEQVLADGAKWFSGAYADLIWGRYGFTDSLDLDQNWIADHVYGITVGPIFLSLANMHEETSVWKDFMKIPSIQVAMARASAPIMAGRPAGQSRQPASAAPLTK